MKEITITLTEEMASAMIKHYTCFIENADKAWEEQDIVAYEGCLRQSTALEMVINDLGFAFRKSYDGTYVIVEI